MLKHKNLFPVIALALISLWTIYSILFVKVEYNGELYDHLFTWNNYLAFAAVIVCFGIYFLARKYFRYAVVSVVVLGLFGVLNYLPVVQTVSIGFLRFQSVSMIVGISYLIINYKKLKSRLDKHSTNPEAVMPDQSQISKFRETYHFKTNEELDEILSDSRFVKEAKIAADQLLKERAS